ncbi:MAG: peptide chain release factor N(5)-glutamine methyltransferase [Halocynthiibacter sp.]
MSAQPALIAAIKRLKDAGIEDAPRDARLLLAEAMGVEATRLTLHLHDPFTSEAQARFDAFTEARAARKPVSQILGRRDFYGRMFKVTSAVLDPRPETETLVEAALAQPFSTVLDLGTGSGAILITVMKEGAAKGMAPIGLGVDLSMDALRVAEENASAHDVAATFKHSNWFSAVEGRFDLIMSNPPYIRADEMADLSPEVRDHEPRMALTPEGDGLDPYRVIAAESQPYLNVDGRIIVEFGVTQHAAVREIFETAGFVEKQALFDLTARVRGAIYG